MWLRQTWFRTKSSPVVEIMHAATRRVRSSHCKACVRLDSATLWHKFSSLNLEHQGYKDFTRGSSHICTSNFAQQRFRSECTLCTHDYIIQSKFDLEKINVHDGVHGIEIPPKSLPRETVIWGPETGSVGFLRIHRTFSEECGAPLPGPELVRQAASSHLSWLKSQSFEIHSTPCFIYS